VSTSMRPMARASWSRACLMVPMRPPALTYHRSALPRLTRRRWPRGVAAHELCHRGHRRLTASGALAHAPAAIVVLVSGPPMIDDAQPIRPQHRIGLLYALGAFTAWGVVLSIYLKALADVPVPEILAHRIVWGALFALALVAALGRRRELSQLLVPRTMALLSLSALLVTINWVTYIYAISNSHIVETSLGYFMNPLVSVALGMLVLGERLRPLQIAACLVAGVGVAILAAATGGLPWIALTLAFSFGFYGLVRKVVAVESLIGFTFEASVLAPLAALYLLWLWASGQSSFGVATPTRDALLLGAGMVTALPLIWFAAAARKLPL